MRKKLNLDELYSFNKKSNLKEVQDFLYESGNELFVKSIYEDDVDVLEKLLSLGYEITLKQYYENINMLPLDNKCRNFIIKQREIIFKIKSNSVNSDELRELVAINMIVNNHSPLFYAALKGNFMVAKFLCSKFNIDPNLYDSPLTDITPHKHTALIAAVESNSIEIVKLILDIPGIDFNAKNFKGLTAYELAKSSNYNEIADLIKNKRDKFITIDLPYREKIIRQNHGYNCIIL